MGKKQWMGSLCIHGHRLTDCDCVDTGMCVKGGGGARQRENEKTHSDFLSVAI